MLTLGLAPVSFALTGPIANLLGARQTLIWAGLVSGFVLVVVLVGVPGIRDVGAREEEEEQAAAA